MKNNNLKTVGQTLTIGFDTFMNVVNTQRDENGRISYLIDKTGTHSTISRLNDTPPVRKTFSDGTPVFFVYTKSDGTKALTTCQQIEESIDKPFSRLYLSDQININDWAFNSSGIYSNDGISIFKIKFL